MKYLQVAIISSLSIGAGALSIPNAASAQEIEAAAAATSLRLSCTATGLRDFGIDVRYEERTGRRRFNASFEAAPTVGFRAGQRLAVHVAGVVVGQMTLVRDPANGDVIGDLTYGDRVPFPAGFPRVTRGTNVVVGTLGCNLN